MSIERGDFIVIVSMYPDKYYRDDVFVVTEIDDSGYRDLLHCKSLFRDECFTFTKNHFIRKITPSAAQKRIKAAITKLEEQANYLRLSIINQDA